MTEQKQAMKGKLWPEGGLERVPNCPICDCDCRTLLHEGLSDIVFFVAPGEWSLWQCEHCRSAWLDPRPTQATIGIAYSNYYTHNEASVSEPRTAFQRLRARLGNGYRNSRYGTHFEPESAWGKLIAGLISSLRRPIDTAYRFLPAPRKGYRRRVLDIGCGGGEWLDVARAAGWGTAGVEPDPIARARAVERGFEVRESVTAWLGEPESFDYVTLSHVIEHVPDPLELLRNAHTLLRPGGGLFIDTPNIDALGHRLYGRHWRGLEVPRHLALFNRKSLHEAVGRANFTSISFRRRISPFDGISDKSRRIAAGLDPYGKSPSPDLPKSPGIAFRLRSALSRRHTEFLTFTAARPK